MKLQNYPTVSNSGFFSKSVQVSYERPLLQREELGRIPFAPPGSALLEEGFVPSSKEHPALPPGMASHEIERDNPQLDACGQPIMEQVDTTITVPGPKAQALSDVALAGVMGATLSTAPGLCMMGLGIVGLMFGSPTAGQLLDAGGRWMVGGAAVGGALGLGIGALDASEQWSRTHRLEWTEKNISHLTLRGYEQKNPEVEGQGTQFEPVFEAKDFGQWKTPVYNW